MRKLFGTDGIRGRADQYPLDDATVYSLGLALAESMQDSSGAPPEILLGMDTRESGDRIARALAAGIVAGGGAPVLGGILPTPAVAWICKNTKAKAGVSISASHNPWQDNGLKIFAETGMKVPDEDEAALETRMEEIRDENLEIPDLEIPDAADMVGEYEDFLANELGEGGLSGLKIVVDPGHGAAYRIAPRVFVRSGADVHVINDQPDGRNINLDAGALHPEKLAEVVRERGADLGVAFDGDADRAIFVDDQGGIRDGDEIIFFWARALKDEGTLNGDLVVTTVMSNLGFEKRLGELGIELRRAQVGDKYVLEEMLESGAVIGGEQSGHLIDLSTHTTGDGVHTALNLCRIVRSSESPLSAMESFEPVPQILINREVSRKPPLDSLPRYQEAERRALEELDGNGRVLIRYSGTEPMVRVMIEGEDRQMIERLAASLADVLVGEIGEEIGEQES